MQQVKLEQSNYPYVFPGGLPVCKIFKIPLSMIKFKELIKPGQIFSFIQYIKRLQILNLDQVEVELYKFCITCDCHNVHQPSHAAGVHVAEVVGLGDRVGEVDGGGV